MAYFSLLEVVNNPYVKLAGMLFLILAEALTIIILLKKLKKYK